MEKITLGNSDLKVSRLCVGCWQFNDNEMDGSRTWTGQTFDVSKEIVSKALECGINFFDTAEGYLNSEDVLGRILEGKRRDVIVATKFGYGSIKKTGYTAVDVEKALTDSLRKLRTDYVDLYQCHWPPVIAENLEEVVSELKRQQSLGRLRYYGVSNFGASDLENFIKAGGEPITNQICYNLLVRNCEYEIIPMCEKQNVSVLPYSPLQQGLLSGRYLSVDDIPEGRRRTRHFNTNSTSLSRHGETGCEKELIQSIHGVKEACEKRSLNMPAVALSWALKQPMVGSAIVGAARPDQIVSNCNLISIDDDLVTELNQVTLPVKEALGKNCDLWGKPDEARVK